MPAANPITLTFLGTGTSQGVPVIACQCEVCRSLDPRDKRLRSSVQIETQGKTFIIDTGPDFRQQLLRKGTKDLTAVLFTHEHKDHLAGLDDVRAFNFLLKKPVELYATKRVQEAIKRDFYYIFADNKYPGVPEVNLHTIGAEPFEVEGVKFTPIQVMHHRMPVLGFRVGDITYITDANYISEEEKEKIKGSKVLILNALRKTEHISHYNLEQALELMEELKPEKGYLTHISHLMGRHRLVSQELPDNVWLAYDQMKVTV